MPNRSNRLFEIIQILRSAARPVSARILAEVLEVTQRTIYRDIVALQATGVPVEGAAGVGYVMRAGYDLPPLMFTSDEIEAIAVGLSLLGRTGDVGLQDAARRVVGKITSVLPDSSGNSLGKPPLLVSNWTAIPASGIDYRDLRRAIREERKLRIEYEDASARQTDRKICPFALIYYVDSVVLAAWCELRHDYRHFRADRIRSCGFVEESFLGQADQMRKDWREQHDLLA
ncbi:MAG: YafY family transcriptional regulator [Paracoccaceae bacterium]|nr:YafY family transcriptional regulator [Paracoccaceae bacterium]